jgi:hypothetical protein
VRWFRSNAASEIMKLNSKGHSMYGNGRGQAGKGMRNGLDGWNYMYGKGSRQAGSKTCTATHENENNIPV